MTLSSEQEQQLRRLLANFLEENAKLNLSAYRTEEQCWIGNILDSVPAYALLSRATAGRAADVPLKVIDVGTGGGFPLLPLAILLPAVQFTGLDATKKKIDAVQRMVNHLALPNVKLLIGRAEELGHPAPDASRRCRAGDPKHREQYDIVLSRAVAGLPTLLEFMSPFARVGGKMLCWKSLAIEEELQASLEARMQLHCRLTERFQYDLDELETGLPAVVRRYVENSQPSLASHFALHCRASRDKPARLRPTASCGGWGKRQILIFEKVKTLPKEFPRRTGIPKKEPL